MADPTSPLDQHDTHDALDDFRAGESSPQQFEAPQTPHTIGPSYTPGPRQGLEHQAEEEGGEKTRDRLKEEARDRATEELKKRGKEAGKRALKKGGKEGVEQGIEAGGKQAVQQGAQRAAQAGVQAGAEAGAEGAASAAGAAGAAGAGATGAAATGAATAGAAVGAEAGVLTAAEGGIAAAGVASAPETAGVGLAAAAAAGVVVAGGAFVVKHWKGALVIACCAFLALFLGVVYMLNIFKPIATTLQAADKFMSPAKTIVNMRSIPILGNYIVNGTKAGQSLGHKTAGKAKQLFDAMNQKNFEDTLKNDLGITFEKNGSGIDVKENGQSLGVVANADDATKLLQNNADLTTKIVDQEVHAWNWAQHFKIARKMTSVFSVPQLNIPGAATALDGKGIADVVKNEVSTVLSPSLTNLGTAITCFVTNQGCKDDGSAVAGQAPAKQELQDNPGSSILTATQNAYNSILDGIKEDTDYFTPRLDTKANANLTDAIQKESLSLLGWLDMSTAFHEISDNTNYGQVPPKLRKQQAASVFMWWWTAAGQKLAGDMTEQSSAVVDRNFSQIEGSQAYNYVAYDDTTRGVSLGDDEKINSMVANPMNTFFTSWIQNNAAYKSAIPILDAWNTIRNSILGPFITLASKTPLAILLSTALTKLPIIKDLFKVFVASPIEEVLGTSFGLSSKLLLPVYDPAEQGPQFGNYLGSGADVIGKEACKVFGCSDHLTAAQMQQINVAYQQENARELANLPLSQRLFSWSTPNSFVNLATLRSPITYAATRNVAAAMTGIFSIVKSLPTNLAEIYAQPARAAGSDPSLIDGVANTSGIDMGTLTNTALSGQLTQDNGACPQTPDGTQNVCTADSSTMDSWMAHFIGYSNAVSEGL